MISSDLVCPQRRSPKPKRTQVTSIGLSCEDPDLVFVISGENEVQTNMCCCSMSMFDTKDGFRSSISCLISFPIRKKTLENPLEYKKFPNPLVSLFSTFKTSSSGGKPLDLATVFQGLQNWICDRASFAFSNCPDRSENFALNRML